MPLPRTVDQIINNPAYTLEYLKKVFDLEMTLYELNKVGGQIRNRIVNNNNWSPPADEQYKELPKMDLSDDVSKWVIVGTVIGGIFGFIRIFRLGGSLLDIFSMGLSMLFQCVIYGLAGAAIFAVVGAIIGLIKVSNRRDKVKKYNRALEQKNAQKDSKAILYKERLEEKNIILSKQFNKIIELYNKTKESLDNYYSVGVIYSKYRSSVPISMFIEYYSSGRCSRLDGPDGAYNKYENELRQNIIIGKLDDIIERLDRIERNQYEMYAAINRSNDLVDSLLKSVDSYANKLQSIENNTQMISYSNKIIERNTEYISWIEYLSR